MFVIYGSCALLFGVTTVVVEEKENASIDSYKLTLTTVRFSITSTTTTTRDGIVSRSCNSKEDNVNGSRCRRRAIMFLGL